MDLAFDIFLYSFMFLIVYFQVFLILTLLENRDSIDKENLNTNDKFPTVTIIVPVFNEEKTVEKTILSLLDLNYPKDRLDIMVVDDGSKDNTWQVVQKFKNNPTVSLHKKENGGKYTALNYAIEHSKSEYIGCLDADSFVDKDALNYILPYFEEGGVMAVTPSLRIQNPDTVLGMMQNAEYYLGIFTRKILGLLDAQYVTPGPFSIFKREVFAEIGPYKHAHNTEDLEMALRLQQSNFKIRNAHKAVVHTVGPRTLYKLYKQRVRWTGGFIQNTLDYRKMILNPKYGNLGFLVLPLALYSIVATLIFLAYNIYAFTEKSIQTIQKASIVGMDWGFSFNQLSTEWWLYNLQSSMILAALAISIVIFAIWYGKRLAGINDRNIMDIVYFLLLYSLISPLWLITSVYNAVTRRDAAWR
jgi:cellulose synthase/poly-beta-1,6-N-acetylglucosamine synthase-like glycosyltransferase